MLLRLVDRADVLVHNIRPQKLEALGLAPGRLCKRNSRLIYASITGARGRALQRAFYGTEESKESGRAYREKRSPRFGDKKK